MPQPRHLHVFLSSPGDVAEEREIARRILAECPYDPLLRGLVTIDVVAWDGPLGPVPMFATETPQSAINRELRRPSECDIVVVIIWSRLGTPLPAANDDVQFRSGTEWEYKDALQSKRKPEILVYRRTGEPVVHESDPTARQQHFLQLQRVDDFFAGFLNADGSIKQGFNRYRDPSEFRRLFELHLRTVIKRLLGSFVDRATESLFEDTGRPTTGAQPKYEEPRRVDAAMPKESPAGCPIEVWAQICVPSSAGLRRALPQFAEQPTDATADDVKAGDLPVVFSVDPVTKSVVPARLAVEVSAQAFTPTRSHQEILLSPERDSGVLVFGLTAPANPGRAKVYVTVKQQLEGSGLFTLGSLVLVMEVQPARVDEPVEPVWTLIDRLLGSVPAGSAERVSEEAPPLQGEPAGLRLELKVVESSERHRIEKYLKLDVPALCSLIPVSKRTKPYFRPTGQISYGEEALEEMRPALREVLRDWRVSEKIPADPDVDQVALIATIAEVIAPVTGEIRPALIAAILVKLGIREFCTSEEDTPSLRE